MFQVFVNHVAEPNLFSIVRPQKIQYIYIYIYYIYIVYACVSFDESDDMMNYDAMISSLSVFKGKKAQVTYVYIVGSK
jgi:hypothetical protein